MQIPKDKKIYFASDFHLGIPNKTKSREREQLLCQWLDDIKHDAAVIFLLGDIFDSWFEYKYVVPKGYTRFLGKLASLTDSGIRIEAFVGNHDLWMKDYFPEELGIPVHHQPLEFTCNGKSFFLAHGDGLGPGDRKYKFLKAVMTNPVSQWLYTKLLHPDWGLGLADYFSKRGAKHQGAHDGEFKGMDKEWLILFAQDILSKKQVDFFIFGHRHLALNLPLTPNSTYFNLGDWILYNSYLEFDGTNCVLKYYNQNG